MIKIETKKNDAYGKKGQSVLPSDNFTDFTFSYKPNSFGTGAKAGPKKNDAKELLGRLTKEVKKAESTFSKGMTKSRAAEVWASNTTPNKPVGATYQQFGIKKDGKLSVFYSSMTPDHTLRTLKKHLKLNLPNKPAPKIIFNFDASKNQNLTTQDWTEIRKIRSTDIRNLDDFLPLNLKIAARHGATQKIDAQRMDFSQKKLGSFTFADLDLSDSKFENCVFRGVNFTGCNVSNATFTNCVFIGCSGVEMEGLDTVKVTGCKTIDKKSKGTACLFDLADKKIYADSLRNEKRGLFKNEKTRFCNRNWRDKDLSGSPEIANMILSHAEDPEKLRALLNKTIYNPKTIFSADPKENQAIHAIIDKIAINASKKFKVRSEVSDRASTDMIIEEITDSYAFKTTGNFTLHHDLPDLTKGQYKITTKPSVANIFLIQADPKDKKLANFYEVTPQGEVVQKKKLSLAELKFELGLTKEPPKPEEMAKEPVAA